uniref:Caskin-2 n=1 Tax=Macrostomum lignano TaxID=282301 RepID=A0A1I8I4N1_9PLAT
LTPLHVASYQGHFDSVHLLLKWNSSINAVAAGGQTPLHLACQGGHYDVVKLLLCNNADPMLRTEDGRTAFDAACEFGHFSIAQLLVSMKSVTGLLYEDCHFFTAADDAKEGTKRQQQNLPSCLHLTARNGHTDVLRLLLNQSGVNVNRLTAQGTCLHLAVAHGHLDAARLLLEIPPPLGPLRLDTVKLRLRTAAERAAQGVPAFVAGRQSHSSGSSIGSLGNSVGGSNGSVFMPAAGGPAIVLPYRPPRSNSLSLSCYGSDSLPRGIDPTLQNSNGQTAKDLITRDTPHARELNQMLSERLSAVEAVAVRDFCDLADPKSIAFRCGERLTVLERAGDIWKGYVTSQGLSRAGYFPSSAVQIQASRHQPEQRPPSGSNDASTGGRSLSVGSTSHPPLPSHLQQAGTGYFNHQAGRHSEGLVPCAIPQLPISTQTSAASTNSSDSAVVGIGAPSPPGISGGGSGNRNSAASLDSGRSSSHTATSCDSRVAFALPPQSSTASNSRLASTSTGAPVATSAAAGVSGGGVAGSAACTSTSRVGGSQDSGLGPRQSLVSTCSSGSLGSLPDDANSSVSSSTGDQLTIEPPYNPADWHRAGLSSEQQLEKFLNACQFGLYLDNFQEAGYDLATLIRCTPEDLNAVGLTDPKHRKRLRQELVRLANYLRLAALPDSIEEAAASAHPMDDVGQFCQRLGLSDCVADCLRQQGFALVQDLANMAWEDLEEIGVSKL